MAVLHEAFAEWSEAREATEAEILRCHTEPHLQVMKTIDGPMWFTGDTPASQTTYRAALLAAGGAIEAVERGGFALVRPPGHHALARPGDGVLLLQQRRDRGPLRAGRARPRARRHPRLGRPPRQRDAGHLPGRRQRALRLPPRVAVLPRLGRAERPGGHDPQHPDVGGLGRRGVPPARSTTRSCRRWSSSGRTCSSCPRGSTHTWTIPWPTSR